MNVIIAGSRSIKGQRADRMVAEAILASGWVDEITLVVHGAAIGIDSAAHRVGQLIWDVKSVPADWDTHGRSAGMIRNRKMAGMADALIAIWDGKSPGTRGMIEIAGERGLRVYVHPCPNIG